MNRKTHSGRPNTAFNTVEESDRNGKGKTHLSMLVEAREEKR
jgi:hypothetical protein